MRAIVLDMPPAWLDERRRSGADRWDEVWNGVLHVVPPPGTEHQRLAGRLERVLTPIAESRGLEVLHETGVFHSHEDERDYRVPDLVVVRAENLSERGVEATPRSRSRSCRPATRAAKSCRSTRSARSRRSG